MKNVPDFFRRGSLAVGGNPYRDMLNLQRQMDRLFSEMWSETPMDAPIVASTPAFAPTCDIHETDSHYLMSFDLPGVKKEDIKIDLQDGTLTVSGERKEECEKKGKNQCRSERFYGSFSRSFQLPAGIKAEQVEASYAEGVLRLAVPKAEALKAQPIKVSEGKPSLWDKLLGHKKEEAKSAPQSAASLNEKRPAEKVA